jgi:hypothetical protein
MPSKTKKNTSKNNTLAKCDQFCKNRVTSINNKYKTRAKKLNYHYTEPKKRDIKFMQDLCMKSFCNQEKCVYPNEPEQYAQFRNKTIQDGFHKKYKSAAVTALKEKGALSGCVYEDDYYEYSK